MILFSRDLASDFDFEFFVYSRHAVELIERRPQVPGAAPSFEDDSMKTNHSITQHQRGIRRLASGPARRQRQHVQSSRGFSLVEVLIALGVFAVGFIAVASMFPAAIMLQKATVIDLESKVVEQNVAAVIKGRGLTFSGTVAADLTPTNVGTLDLIPFTSHAPIANKWSISDRGYPTFMTDIASRRFFWVPFLRRTSAPDPATPTAPTPDPLVPATKDNFLLLGFIQKRQPGSKYINAATDYSVLANPSDGDDVPKVVRVAVTAGSGQFSIDAGETQAAKDHFAAFEPGNSVADNRGTVYIITDVSGSAITVGGIVPVDGSVTHLWYGAPPDGSFNTSTVAIVTLAGLVKEIP